SLAEGSQVVGLVCGGRRCYPAFTAIALRRHQDIHHNGQSTEHFAPTPCCCVGWVMSPSRQCSFLLCRNEKAQGVNLGLKLFVSTIKAMATISDLHEIYAFQSSFASLK